MIDDLIGTDPLTLFDIDKGASFTATVYLGWCSECPNSFYTPYPNKKTCGPECSKVRQKRLKRLKYAQDPEPQKTRVRKYQKSDKGKATIEANKEQSKEKSKAWWDRNRDSVNARRREKYAREKKR